MKRTTRPIVQGIAQHRGMMNFILMIMRRMKVVQGDAGQHMRAQIDIDLCKNGDKGQSDQGTHQHIVEATVPPGNQTSVAYQGSVQYNQE